MDRYMMKLKTLALLALLLIFAVSCDGLKMTKNIFETSERAKYERRFSGSDSLMMLWKNDFSAALSTQLQIPDGFSAKTFVNPGPPHALAYSLDLKKGDRLVIEVSPLDPERKIFVDMFDESKSVESSKSQIIENGIFSENINTSANYKVVIQSEIEYAGSFALKIDTQPSLSFPVVGKGNADVQSFWGASRDGGARSHEGLDIFAARGTYVVAAADGYVTRTGDQGLGGKQVWLRDGIFGNALYYAHLDSIIAESGKKVKIGDTLGQVGNTGNAKGGPTHLHFGIYSTGGAVDAYPFIRKRPIPKTFKNTLKKFTTIKPDTNLRKGPGTSYESIATPEKETPIKILSSNGDWYHIKTTDGTQGFVNSERLK